MNFRAFSFAFLTAFVLLVQSCGTDTTSDNTELATVLDGAADREGVPHGECRDTCAAAALVVFDECTEGSDDREACFGTAIHAFFECARSCKPATCEDRCEAKVKEEYDECVELTENPDACAVEGRELLKLCVSEFCDDPEPPTCEGKCELAAAAVLEECLDGLEPGGDEAGCTELAREALAECIAENCKDPEPPTCEDRCGKFANHVFDACMSKIDSEDRCAKIARCVQEHCMDRCEGHPCDCDRDCDCDDDDSDSDSDGHGDCDCDDDGDSDSDKDKDKDKDRDKDKEKDCERGPYHKSEGCK